MTLEETDFRCARCASCQMGCKARAYWRLPHPAAITGTMCMSATAPRAGKEIGSLSSRIAPVSPRDLSAARSFFGQEWLAEH